MRPLLGAEAWLVAPDGPPPLPPPAAARRAPTPGAPAPLAADDPLDHGGGTAREPTAAGIATQGPGIDSTAAAGYIRGDQRTRRKARAPAGTHAWPGAGPDTGAGFDVFLKLRCNRRTAQIGELV